LTPLYDPPLRLSLREKEWRPAVAAQLAVDTGDVLDLGCGTGTLTVEIARRYSKSAVHGIDIDHNTLKIAQNKIGQTGEYFCLVKESVTSLPFSKNRFDCVVSSLLSDHLTTEQKLEAISEAYRVLCPGRAFHLVDWGTPASRLQRSTNYVSQLLDRFETTTENIEGKLPIFLKQSGFIDVRNTGHTKTSLGTIRTY
jgi:ubiquinone/menaquinone biosynthesis C-methylase UbiE